MGEGYQLSVSDRCVMLLVGEDPDEIQEYCNKYPSRNKTEEYTMNYFIWNEAKPEDSYEFLVTYYREKKLRGAPVPKSLDQQLTEEDIGKICRLLDGNFCVIDKYDVRYPECRHGLVQVFDVMYEKEVDNTLVDYYDNVVSKKKPCVLDEVANQIETPIADTLMGKISNSAEVGDYRDLPFDELCEYIRKNGSTTWGIKRSEEEVGEYKKVDGKWSYNPNTLLTIFEE